MGHGPRGLRARAFGAIARAFVAAAVVVLAAPTPARAQVAGDVVAVLETKVQAQKSYIVRGTIPVPPGFFPRQDGRMPLSVVNPDNSVAPTQVEIVSRYPRDVDGADVVEVLARVQPPSGAAVGSTVQYEVIYDVHVRGNLMPAPEIEQLVNTPGSLLVVAKDVFGHSYGVELHPPGRQKFQQGRAWLERYGNVAVTVKTYGTMIPATQNIGAPNGALPHLFGVHAYLTGWTGEDVLSLDLRINNGASNNDKSSSIDDLLGDVYFQSLELWVPKGWAVVQQGPDPLFGSSRSQGTWTAYSIVAADPNGQMHFMPHLAQFHRRLALYKPGNGAKAQRFVDDQTLAFCREGVSPTSGMKLWSWWNPQTARYFPQRHRLPNLDHVGQATLAKDIDKTLNPLLSSLQSGQSSIGVLKTGRMGYAQPWGASYGGMTGGTEIYIFDGLVTASAASQRGYMLASLTHRLYQDRQPDAYFNSNGEPTAVEDWLVPVSGGMSTNMFFKQKLLSGPDPFGYSSIDPFQVNHVAKNNLQPGYEKTLAGYQPVDFQHYVRTTRSAKVLAWLGNDPLAKDDLLTRAEIYRLSYHQHFSDLNGGYQGSGLKSHNLSATKNPGAGLFFGRGNGWGIDSVNAAYSFGDATYRSRVLPWYKILADTVTAGQFSCNGFIQAKQGAKILGGMYNGRQQYEESIVENGLRGALESGIRGVDGARQAQLETVIGNSVLAMISPMAWDPVQNGPWKQVAVSDIGSPTQFCGLPNPPGGTGSGVDKYQCWSSFALRLRADRQPAVDDARLGDDRGQPQAEAAQPGAEQHREPGRPAGAGPGELTSRGAGGTRWGRALRHDSRERAPRPDLTGAILACPALSLRPKPHDVPHC